MFIIALLLLFSAAQDLSSYHPKLLMKKYIRVKNQKLQRLLIGGLYPFKRRYSTKSNPKTYQDKMTVVGLVAHIILAAFICVSAFLLAFAPKVPFKPNVDTYAVTFNQYIVGETALILLLTFFCLFVLNISKGDGREEHENYKAVNGKFRRASFGAFTVYMILILVALGCVYIGAIGFLTFDLIKHIAQMISCL